MQNDELLTRVLVGRICLALESASPMEVLWRKGAERGNRSKQAIANS
jgi:hypothetical protein